MPTTSTAEQLIDDAILRTEDDLAAKRFAKQQAARSKASLAPSHRPPTVYGLAHFKSVLMPETVTPSQFFEGKYAGSIPREVFLYKALLDDALFILRRYPRGCLQFCEVIDWIRDGEAIVPFAVACEICGLEPAQVRKGLEAIALQNTAVRHTDKEN